jgi:hypothetical protein
MVNISTPWKKSRTFGDIYGGRQRLRLNDNIFQRAHSLNKPSESDEIPILIQDNPSRDFIFPINANEAKEAIRALPNHESEGITHIWLRRLNKTEYEKGQLPLAEFICGSGVRLIVLYPFPKSLKMDLGKKKPSARKLKELRKFSDNIAHSKDGWSVQWDIDSLRRYYINNLLYHEIGHHVDWYSRHWSTANNKQLEEFADQYAIQRTALATKVVNKLQSEHGEVAI